eukprot:7941625-Alexandrium_andersonii.AAC.1
MARGLGCASGNSGTRARRPRSCTLLGRIRNAGLALSLAAVASWRWALRATRTQPDGPGNTLLTT